MLDKETSNSQMTGKFCPICYQSGNKEMALPNTCSHEFCFDCIVTWSKVHNTCPICKTEFQKIHSVDPETKQPKVIEVNPCIHIPDESEDSFEELIRRADDYCYACNRRSDYNYLLICEMCDTKCCHSFCLDPPLQYVPMEKWYCDFCAPNLPPHEVLIQTANILGRKINHSKRKSKGAKKQTPKKSVKKEHTKTPKKSNKRSCKKQGMKDDMMSIDLISQIEEKNRSGKNSQKKKKKIQKTANKSKKHPKPKRLRIAEEEEEFSESDFINYPPRPEVVSAVEHYQSTRNSKNFSTFVNEILPSEIQETSNSQPPKRPEDIATPVKYFARRSSPFKPEKTDIENLDLSPLKKKELLNSFFTNHSNSVIGDYSNNSRTIICADDSKGTKTTHSDIDYSVNSIPKDPPKIRRITAPKIYPITSIQKNIKPMPRIDQHSQQSIKSSELLLEFEDAKPRSNFSCFNKDFVKQASQNLAAREQIAEPMFMNPKPSRPLSNIQPKIFAGNFAKAQLTHLFTQHIDKLYQR